MDIGRAGSRQRRRFGGISVSEQNYSSYASGEERRPRSRSGSGQRSGDGPRRPKKGRGRGGLALRVIGTLLLIAVTTGAILCCFGAVYVRTVILPKASLDLGDVTLRENSVMYYEDDSGQYQELGQVLTSISSQWVEYEEIPEDLKNAAIAIEDRRFLKHNGVDWWRTAQAVFSMFTGGDIQGGSTITQQLIKNLTEDNETTVNRKVTEIFRALEFDRNYDKDTTLLWYLNVIPLGAGCEGVGAAAEKYFGKPVSELTLAECASLIAITNNPSKYGPYSLAKVANSKGELWDAKQWNKYRQELILNQMLKEGYITQEEHDQAVAQELVFVGMEAGSSGDSESPENIYSWYEEQVISDVIKDLKEKYDYSDKVASQMLASGGLRIYTCIDPEVQKKAEAVYGDEELLNYVSKSTGQRLQSAITIIDNETGDIAALVGRIGEKEINRGLNLATNAKRQPGSSIKPLSAYAPAIEMGLMSPITVMPDYPYQVLGGKAWPVNVDGVYRGQVTVNQAVEDSYNTVAVRTVAQVTPAKAFEFATQRFHLPLESGRMVNGEVKGDIGIAPLAMGGLTDGVSTRDMANAFSVFPNGGVYRQARTYTKVENSKGEVILDNTREDSVAVKDTTAYYINSMLTNVVTSGGGTEARISGMTTAGKTGTTDTKDNRWFVGYTPYYTAAVWVGYETPERVPAPGNPAAQVFKKVMTPIHEGLADRKFPQVSGLVSVSYCMDCGGEAIEACQYDARGSSRIATGYVFPEDRPSFVCSCHSLEEGSNSMVRVCVDDPILDANGEFTGFYRAAGPFCPEVSVRTLCYLNLDRESVGGAVARDSSAFYSAYLAAAGGQSCTVHSNEPSTEEPEPGAPEEPSEPGTDDPALPPDPENSGGDGALINPDTGVPYGY